jgi:hypothetical protein
MIQNRKLFGCYFRHLRSTMGRLRSLSQVKDCGVFSICLSLRAESTRMSTPVRPPLFYEVTGKIMCGNRKKLCAGDMEFCRMITAFLKIVFESLTTIKGGGVKPLKIKNTGADRKTSLCHY